MIAAKEDAASARNELIDHSKICTKSYQQRGKKRSIKLQSDFNGSNKKELTVCINTLQFMFEIVQKDKIVMICKGAKERLSLVIGCYEHSGILP